MHVRDGVHQQLSDLLQVLSSKDFTNVLHVINNSHAEFTSPTFMPSPQGQSKDAAYEGFYSTARFGTALIGYPITGVLGIIGSVLCIIVLNRKQMRTSTNTYLTALAIADLLKLLNDFMYFPAMVLHYHQYHYVFQLLFAFYYPYAFFLSQYTAGNAAWLTVSVAFERFLMVVHPAWSRNALTINKARVAVLLVCLSNLCINFPFMMRFQTVTKCKDKNDTGWNFMSNNLTMSNESVQACSFDVESTRFWNSIAHQQAYTMFHGCMRSIVPLLVLIFLNARIVHAVRQTRANKKLASRNRVTIMLIVVICCCIFLATPDAIMTLMGYGYVDETSNFRKGIREITDLLLTVNSAVNFYLYMAFNRVFQQNFLWLCYDRTECMLFDERPQCVDRLDVSNHSRSGGGSGALRRTGSSLVYTRSTRVCTPSSQFRSRCSVSQARNSILIHNYSSVVGSHAAAAAGGSGETPYFCQVGKRLSNAAGADINPLLALQQHSHKISSCQYGNLLTVPGQSSSFPLIMEQSEMSFAASNHLVVDKKLDKQFSSNFSKTLLIPPAMCYGQIKLPIKIPIITLDEPTD